MGNDSDTPIGSPLWVVAADSTRAEIYRRRKRFSELELVRTLLEPMGRAKESELSSDAPGRAFDSAGAGRHAMEPEQTAREHLRESFARRIAEELDGGRTSGAYRGLVLVAGPDMLGALRGRLSRATQRLVALEIVKDMTGMDAACIAAEIDEHAS